MQIDSDIFKAYDIRGIYPSQINEKIAESIGRAFIVFTGAVTVVVGRDMRQSSPLLFNAVTHGIITSGANVTDIGLVSTDQFYYACATQNLPGIMITASHNPAEYGGFKMVKEMPCVIGGDTGLQQIHQIIETDSFHDTDRVATVQACNLIDEFVEFVLSIIDVDSITPIQIAVDPRSGMVGPILQKVFNPLPVNLSGFNLKADGRLPVGQGLDPKQPQNHADLQRYVVDQNADVGFAFDGDGDRFFVVDDRGQFVPSDFIIALIAEYLLLKHPESKIVYDIRGSWAIRDTVEANKGIPIIERVGHSFIKPTMMNRDAIFGGEGSGHYYFRDFFYADSGIIPALILTEILSEKQKKLSTLLQPYEEKYFLSEEVNTQIKNGDPDGKIESIRRMYHQSATVNDLDGLSVEFDDWHFNLRKSNTEPLIRLNLEARSHQIMIEKRAEIIKLIGS